MDSFTFIILSLSLVAASAFPSGLWVEHGHAINPAAHIPSGSVGVSAHGAVVAGPAGSVKTDNGLHGHGAGAVLSGPSGEVATREGHTVLIGPGGDHNDGHFGPVHVAAAAAVVAAAPTVVAAAPALVAAPVLSHAVVAPAVSHAVVAPPVVPASTVLLEPTAAVATWGPAGAIHAGWTHGGVYAGHGYGLGHHGW